MEIKRSPIVEKVIGCAIAVHRMFGPGLLESAYQAFLLAELQRAGLKTEREVALSITHLDVHIACAYRLDLVVEGELVVELKTVEAILPVHRAQLLTYAKLAKVPQGLLINFNVTKLVDGIVSVLA